MLMFSKNIAHLWPNPKNQKKNRRKIFSYRPSTFLAAQQAQQAKIWLTHWHKVGYLYLQDSVKLPQSVFIIPVGLINLPGNSSNTLLTPGYSKKIPGNSRRNSKRLIQNSWKLQEISGNSCKTTVKNHPCTHWSRRRNRSNGMFRKNCKWS